ncbi:hypothetical protein YC2023_060008 [Brassica napus]|uniref:(rape) hypothetical protein n=1 Tax=Brassica napus TaxID=3708 RepID=A0A816LCD9_BRANA|nr:unnamed protein product [Brassica napus]
MITLSQQWFLSQFHIQSLPLLYHSRFREHSGERYVFNHGSQHQKAGKENPAAQQKDISKLQQQILIRSYFHLLHRDARTERLNVLRQKRKLSGTNEIINIPSKRKTQASTKTPILSDGQLYISPTETQSTCLMYWKTNVLDMEHCSGSLKPSPNKAAKFSQLYIHDTENEVQNRISALSGNSDKSNIRPELVESIMEMLRASNVHVKTFRNAIDRFNDGSKCQDVKLVLNNNCQKDGRVYNLPTSSEVAALVVGDFQLNMDKRDIILEKYSVKLKRINELHPCYLPLQYPFPYGEDGFRLGIQNGFMGINKWKKPNISMR